LIIGVKQPPNGVPINMHNIYVTLSSLCSLGGLIILRDVSFQDICKPKFKKALLKMTKPISPKNVNKNDTFENTQTKLPHIKIE